MHRLKEKYQQEIVPAMRAAFNLGNDLAAPRIEKIVVNIGTGKGLKENTFNDVAVATLERITGQRPIQTKARKSISNFKIRAGQTVGMKVTLRGRRMYDFLDRLINVTLPRVRDFRGIDPKAVDQSGNLNLGFKEHVAFPEVRADEVEQLHGLQVTIKTTADSRETGLDLLTRLGIPFKK